MAGASLYLGSLARCCAQSFYRSTTSAGLVDETFSARHVDGRSWTAANRDIILRTVTMAAAVTLACARVRVSRWRTSWPGRARPRTRTVLFVAVLLPLWSSYLVRVYAWKLILAQEGSSTWFLDRARSAGCVLDGVLDLPVIGGPILSTSLLGQCHGVPLHLVAVHDPAARGLAGTGAGVVSGGARRPRAPTRRRTFRKVVWPLAFPGVVAGSIFTFSLTLGDYIIPTIIGNSSPSIGERIYIYQGTAGNLPLAAAFAVVPDRDHGALPALRPAPRERSRPCEREREDRVGEASKGAVGAVLLFLYFPLVIVFLYAFTTEEAAFTSRPRR